jgi:cell division protein FtsL
MDDFDLSKELTNAVTNIVKNTDFYGKAKKVSYAIYGISIFCGIYAVFNYVKHERLCNDIDNLKNQIKRNTQILDSLKTSCNKLLERTYKIKQLEETMHFFTERDDNSSNEIENKEPENKEPENKESENKVRENSKLQIITDEEENELLNESYDNIPCSNVKKITGLFGVFKWK